MFLHWLFPQAPVEEYNMKIGGIVNPDGGLSFFTDPVSEALVKGSLRVKDGLWKGLVLSICNSYVSMQLNCWTLKGLNSFQPCLRTPTLKVCRYFGVRMS